jgi:chemotaxis protein methyltransferase CheR
MTGFAALLRRIEERYGLLPRPHARQAFEEAAAGLVAGSPLPRSAALASALAETSELRRFAALLTVDETYFFRHPEHYPPMAAHLGARVRAAGMATVWSAGCSSGEEPYSIAMTLADRLAVGAALRVRILATDLKPENVQRARAAIYGPWSFRGTTDSLRHRWFVPRPGGRFELHRTIRERVDFSATSIQEALSEFAPGSLDAIAFRNVAVYLSRDALSALYGAFAQVLAPGGLLFIAPTDPRPIGAEWVALTEEDTTVFVRADATAGRAAVSGARLRSGRVPERRSSAPVPQRAAGQNAPPSRETAPISDALGQARALADRGDLSGALALLDARLRRVNDDRTATLMRAQVRVAGGQIPEALTDLGHLLSLEPDHAIGRYWRVIALRALGEDGRAAVEARQLEDALSSGVGAGGLTSTETRELRAALAEMSEPRTDGGHDE